MKVPGGSRAEVIAGVRRSTDIGRQIQKYAEECLGDCETRQARSQS